MPKSPLQMTVDVKLGRGARMIALARAVQADPLATATGKQLAQAVLESVRAQASAPRAFKTSLPDDVAKAESRAAQEPANTDEWEAKAKAREESQGDDTA